MLGFDMPPMISRSRKQLTHSQERVANAHYSRLLKRHPKAPMWKRALLKANAVFLALNPQFFTYEHGMRLRRIKGAKHAHRNIRLRGGVPGEEARAAAQRNRRVRRLKPFTDMGWRMPRS
jgi:hypothetical protein